MFETTPISNPMDHVKFGRHDKEPVFQLVYLKVIGSLMYEITCTRPDIAFAVTKLGRFTSIPGLHQCMTVRRELKILEEYYGLW